MNTVEYLAIANAIVPHRTGIVFEGRRLTFQSLQERVNRLANALADLGVGAGDRVALMDVNTPELIESYLASARLDAIFVPLNYRARADEFSQMLRVCEPTVLMVGKRYQELARSALKGTPPPNYVITLEERDGGQWVFYDDLIESSSPEELHFPTADDMDTTLLLFTAGTTGDPKAVMLNHDSFSSYMLSSVLPADPEVEERNLLSVPMYHIAGMQGALAAIYGGRTLLLMRQFEAQQWMELVQKERADRAGMVPTMLKQVVDHPNFGDYDLSSLKIITYGAAPMPLEVIKKAIAAFPDAKFINAFGQTETASTITMLPPEDHVLEGTEDEIEKKLKHLTSVGKPLEDVEVAILDKDGHELPNGQVGEVAAKGPRLMSGYWKDGQATRGAYHGDWLLTGDLGYRDEDDYIYLAGRSKDFIKRGGEMVSPEEVERVLMSHPAVDDAAIIGVPDLQWGERVRAVVVPHKGKSVSASELIEYCHQRLASFKRPESVVFVDELPRNPLGKVLKRVLRERYSYPIEELKTEKHFDT
ncbi:MAG: long-chain-fatty-acid--CoA ligase [Chloroflexi bacterium]|nr:long-chain-fatty-acid--CoA ligase [Chloroflexota bacterium]